jgi:hypothetical protein
MKRLIVFFTVIISILFLFKSCYYDNEEALYPELSSSCDTNNITFSTSIATILANNCLTCHSNTVAGTSGNGIRLQDYADVVARVTAVSGAIKHTGGYSPMPKSGGMLKACLINQFDIWVSKGFPNK